MIIPFLGKLSVAQAITDADEISENVIQVAAVDYAALTDAWWVVDTNVVAATAGTLKFALVLATAANLATSVEVCSVNIAAITDTLQLCVISRTKKKTPNVKRGDSKKGSTQYNVNGDIPVDMTGIAKIKKGSGRVFQKSTTPCSISLLIGCTISVPTI